MMCRIRRFNAFLLMLGVLAGAGCKSPLEQEDMSSIQFHLEANSDGSDRVGPVTVGRSVPFQVNVEKDPFMSERYLKDAEVVASEGGFSLKLHFEQKGTWLLEQISTAHKGRRVAILGRWEGAGRWLGAPRLEKRITDGVLVFSPDTTREEAERFVEGLNKAVKVYESGRF